MLVVGLAQLLEAAPPNIRLKVKPKLQTTTPFSPILQETNQINEDGSHTFGYVSGDGSFRTETRFTDGTVTGQYGYIDPDGVMQKFDYGSGRPVVHALKMPVVKAVASSEEQEEEEDEEEHVEEFNRQKIAVGDSKEATEPKSVDATIISADEEVSLKEQLSQLTIPEPLLHLARLNIGDQLEQFGEPVSRRELVEMALHDLQDQMTKLDLPQKLQALGRQDLSDRLIEQARQWSSYLSKLSDHPKN